jgi:HlyD family secretion protein
MLYGIITLFYPDGRRQDALLTKELITIGRDPANDIVVDDDYVSRNHAMLECNQDGIVLTHLSETSSTVVAGRSLARSERIKLTNAIRMALGPSPVSVEVRLGPHAGLAAEEGAPALVVQPKIECKPEPKALTIAAGGVGTLTLTLVNRADRAINIALSWIGDGFPGEPSFSEQRVGLMHEPGAEQREKTIAVTVLVPRRYSSFAGEHRFWIKVDYTETFPGSEPELIEVPVVILPYVAFESSVVPEVVEARGRGRYDLHLANRGNVTLPLRIMVTDREQALRHDVPAARTARATGRTTGRTTGRRTSPERAQRAAEIDILPGENRRVPVYIAPKRWRLVGRRRDYKFGFVVLQHHDGDSLRQVTGVPLSDEDVERTLADPSAQPQRLEAELVQRPISPWAVLLALLPLVLLAAWFLALRPEKVIARPTVEFTFDGRVVPAVSSTSPLVFARDGQLAELLVKPGDRVTQGQSIARLRSDEQKKAVEQAELQLEHARTNLTNAERQRDLDLKAATQALDQAQKDLKRLEPGGRDDVLKAATKARDEAEQAYRQAIEQGSSIKAAAQAKLEQAKASVLAAQQEYQQAERDRDWVRRKKSHPREWINNDAGDPIARPLTDVEKQQFEDAVEVAQLKLDETGKQQNSAIQELQLALKQEETLVKGAEQNREQADEAYKNLQTGKGNQALDAAQKAVDDARLNIEKIEARRFDDQRFAVQQAEQALERAQEQLALSELKAPRDGQIYLFAKRPGDAVTSVEAMGMLVDNRPELDVAVTLSPEIARLLTPNLPVTVTMTLPTTETIHRADLGELPQLPEPGAASASQSIVARFALQLGPGEPPPVFNTPVRVSIVSLPRQDVRWLPPQAVRSSGNQRFVQVRDLEFLPRRVPVQPETATDEWVAVRVDPTALPVGAEADLP